MDTQNPVSPLPPLTAAQLMALDTYAFLYGRNWKSKLRAWWMNPRVVSNEQERLVYALRNTHGTTWLMSFRFPRKSVCCETPLLDGVCCSCLQPAAPRVA